MHDFLSFSDGSEDPATTPFLEIADQKGNPILIPLYEKKVTMSQLCCFFCVSIQKKKNILQYFADKESSANCLNSAVRLSNFN